MWLEDVVNRRGGGGGVARNIICIKVCYFLIQIFLHNKIHLKINSIIYKGIHV